MGDLLETSPPQDEQRPLAPVTPYKQGTWNPKRPIVERAKSGAAPIAACHISGEIVSKQLIEVYDQLLSSQEYSVIQSTRLNTTLHALN